MKRTRENGAPTDALPSTVKTMNALQRVTALRALMRKHNLQAFLIPSEDAHMSEYVAACDERRAFLTGFTGSAGTALVTGTAAYCWTDGRYFVQARKQLDASVFKMMKIYEDPPVDQWVAHNLPDGATLGVDGRTLSVTAMKRLRTAVATAAAAKRKLSIVCLPTNVPNLVDTVWASARPAPPASTVFVHPDRYAGRSVRDKLVLVREKMVEKGATLLMVTGLDEVAWLLNLRGSDVDFNPVFWSYVIVSRTEVTMYVNETRFGEGVAVHLQENGVRLRGYDALYEDLRTRAWDEGDKVWVDPNICNYAIVDCIEGAKAGVQFFKKQGPIALAKARKNEVELQGMKECHLRDGVAMCKFLCWLEREMENGGELDEVSVADKLDGLRSEQEMFVSLSFPTISSAGANGAIIHYKPEKATCAKLTQRDMYVVDSGGQYRDGTTDVTRTLHLGEPTEWQRECFTRVLRGHIAIDTAVFPKGTTGHLLDVFARRALWEIGLDYKHGTGHGVGSFLNVHEGPHVVSFKTQALETALDVGFLTSNEPGYYEENGFGIRIENICVIGERKVRGPPGGPEKMFMGLEHVTVVPLQRKLIDVKLLTVKERMWVDAYHAEILQKLTPRLHGDDETLAWLRKATQQLS